MPFGGPFIIKLTNEGISGWLQSGFKNDGKCRHFRGSPKWHYIGQLRWGPKIMANAGVSKVPPKWPALVTCGEARERGQMQAFRGCPHMARTGHLRWGPKMRASWGTIKNTLKGLYVARSDDLMEAISSLSWGTHHGQTLRALCGQWGLARNGRY